MRTQLILVAICFCLCKASCEDRDSVNKIRGEVLKLLKGTEELNDGLRTVKNVQKGIEEKFKHQRDEIDLIAALEVALSQLETKVHSSFDATASGVRNLTEIIRAVQSQNERSIQNLTNAEVDIRRVIGQFDVDQDKYEKILDALAASVKSQLAGIQQLIGQAVIGELIGLDNKAKVLQVQQRNIIGQVGHLEELNALANRANRKVNQLEWGLVALNRTQSENLNIIENTVHGVQVTSSQIDLKLGALLDNQKNIEKSLENCKRKNPPDHKPQHGSTHPEPSPNHQYKPEVKPEVNPGYESSYASQEEAEQLYKLWYNKGQQQ
ncbi:uncharacterized protein LOC108094468 [Drosophila ficusphila]|uniref:uncharacterized protein LOC108094468 n=1 Tax=Drosophila ficusphila TaxID=30025 RepID=UPI001C8A01E7|nr:uncharacterized protein LOC108094468 [Drosophila ficusphila]